MTNWHDTPPTKAGRYYVKRWNGQEMTARVYEENGRLVFESVCGSRYLCEKGLEEHYKFGPRIPTADELAELPGLVEEYVDAVRSAAICGEQSSRLQGFYERCEDGILAKINAILGVADDVGAD